MSAFRDFLIRSGDLDRRGKPVPRPAAGRPSPHRNPPRGLGFLDVGGEVLEMDAEVLRELMDPADLAPGSPGFGDHSAPVVPPATETPRERRERQDRERRRGLAREVLLGRTSPGTPGDVDLPDSGVSESWYGPDLRAAVRRCLDVIQDRSSSPEESDAAARRLARLEEAEHGDPQLTREALAALDGAERAVRRRAEYVDHARRLTEGAERACKCSVDGGGDRVGCGGLCSMADRWSRRVAGARLPAWLERRAQRRADEIERERRAGRGKREDRGSGALAEFLRESGDLRGRAA